MRFLSVGGIDPATVPATRRVFVFSDHSSLDIPTLLALQATRVGKVGGSGGRPLSPRPDARRRLLLYLSEQSGQKFGRRRRLSLGTSDVTSVSLCHLLC